MSQTIYHNISPVGKDGVVRCWHNELALYTISHTARNPNRGFYTCKKPKDRCKFWSWEDELELRPRGVPSTSTPPPTPPPAPPILISRLPPGSPSGLPSTPQRVMRSKPPRTPSSEMSPEQRDRRDELIRREIAKQTLTATAADNRAAAAPNSHPRPFAAPTQAEPTTAQVSADKNPFFSSQEPPPELGNYVLPPVTGSALAGPLASSASSASSQESYYDVDEDIVMVAGANAEPTGVSQGESTSQRTVRGGRGSRTAATPSSSPGERSRAQHGTDGRVDTTGPRRRSHQNVPPIEAESEGSASVPVDRKGKGRARPPPDDFPASERRGRWPRPSTSSSSVSSPHSPATRSSSPLADASSSRSESPALPQVPFILEMSRQLITWGEYADDLAKYVEALEGERDRVQSRRRELEERNDGLIQENAHLEEEIARLRRKVSSMDKGSQAKATEIERLQQQNEYLKGQLKKDPNSSKRGR